jgi:hypothetical protein
MHEEQIQLTAIKIVEQLLEGPDAEKDSPSSAAVVICLTSGGHRNTEADLLYGQLVL